MVRAKFRLNKIELTEHQRQISGNGSQTNPYRYETCELRTLVFAPVYSSDPKSENRKFWESSPSGELRLGTINQGAWEQFRLGGEYYLDFTSAD